MTEENIPEMNPDSESELNNNGGSKDIIEQAIAEAVAAEKPKRRTRRKKGVGESGAQAVSRYPMGSAIEGVTVAEAIGYCSECGHAVYKDDKECRGCGARFNDSSVDELVNCPHCGTTIDLEGFRGQFKCPSCGHTCIAED